MSGNAARKMRPPTPAQRRAADPTVSVWVTANAGTGKTRVLSDRVLRLLLTGAEPEGILCITFTKAAAAEMTVRIEERLAAWATNPADAALAEELLDLTGEPADAPRLALARQLFARILELPGGLNIMTIHALCGSLLRRFPIEAGVPPHFETIDERTAAELMQEAREQVLAAGRDARPPLGKALQVLAITLADGSLTDALNEVLAERSRLLRARALFRDDLEGLIEAVYRTLGAKPGDEPPAILEQACADGIHDGAGLLQLANALQKGGKKQQEAAAKIAAWLGAVATDRVRTFEVYEAVFLTKQKTCRADICTEKFRREQIVFARIYEREQVRLGDVCDRIKGLVIARRTEALLRVGFAVLDAYERLKAYEAGLDYDDLIEKARALLSLPGKRDWVLYKLDARIDHVLVDEAQDTSPAQWEIIERLSEEFLAGAGARAPGRTLFVVGDEKQSIYRFQGADLANFRRVKARLLERAAASGQTIRLERLDRSFRSVRAVLEAVDAVFAIPEAKVGVVDLDEEVRHATERGHEPGLIELWPLAKPAEAEAPAEPWPLPDAPRASDEPERRVAQAIASTISGWLARGELLESAGQPIRPGDILVLVTRRGVVQELVIRALKQAGIPVAGADRLALRDHIAVKDLIAFGRAMLLPEDDLNLACLLKSPLVGLDEEALFELAWDRGRSSLLERLREAAHDRPERFAEAYGRLSRWLQRADFMPPFELFAWVLGADGGRKRLVRRLGPDAIEPIEAFLGQALAYEQGHPSSLQGFLHWVCMASDQVKRDAEKAHDLVRVTTVHGAKGLEAPIVFLADAGPQGGARRGRLLWGHVGPEGRGAELPFWRPAKADHCRFTERLADEDEAREREERRRLFYVALTRARDRLYVTGWLTRRSRMRYEDEEGQGDGAAEPSWHDLLRQALWHARDAEIRSVALARNFEGQSLRLRRGVADAAATGPAVPAPVRQASPLPAWAQQPPAPEPPAARPLAPSRQAQTDDPPPASPAGQDGSARFRYGTLVHKLLQHLPEIPPERRARAAERLLASTAQDLPEEVRRELIERVLAVLDAPGLAHLFGPGSRAEQAICGLVGEQAIVGQVDRLAVTATEVVIVDYKSNRTPPPTVDGTPVAYLRQLAAYRALLARLYPDRTITAALLWTATCRLDLIPPDLMDAHAPGGTPGKIAAPAA